MNSNQSLNNLQPNLDAAQYYLNRLAPDAEFFTFQTFDDAGDDWQLRRILQGSIEQVSDRLERLNSSGASINVTVNHNQRNSDRDRGRPKRGNKYITRVRAVFADLDDVEDLSILEQSPLKPHLVVSSSEENYHAYWLVKPGLSKGEFRQIQIEIARRFGGDDVKDPCRVLRLPGFYHLKDRTQPQEVRLIREHEHSRYSTREIKEAFPPRKQSYSPNYGHRSQDTSEFELPETIPKGQRNTTLTKYAGKLWGEGHSSEELLRKLRQANSERCKPSPIPDKELKKMVNQAESNWDRSSGKQTQAQKILGFALQEFELFQSEKKEPYVSVRGKGGIIKHWKLSSEKVKDFISAEFFEQYGKPPSSSSLNS